ncbi:MAG: TraB/GumN family protein [Prevotella sp.]|nr:TraB/GumN family protein [Prevotella sp.]
MKKTILSVLFCSIVAAVPCSAQLLYKISGNGLEKPSYIIGTHHLANVGFVEKINGVKEALTEIDQVYGELKWDEMTNPDSVKLLQNAMIMPDGKTLKDVMTAEQYKKLDDFLKTKMGVGLSSPQVGAQMNSMSPMAIVTQLQVLMFMMNHMGEFDPTSTFDQYFQAQAQKNNLPCGGLETVSFQAKVLYGGQTMERQVENLMCLIDNEQFNSQMMEDMTNAFYAQDLDGLKKAMDLKLGNSCDSTPEEIAQLIDNRNADWLTKMPAIMKEHATFFAVGAGHLPGEKGVLQLLRNAGYTVEGVK